MSDVIYTANSLPSVAGNDPNHVCRDIPVAIPDEGGWRESRGLYLRPKPGSLIQPEPLPQGEPLPTSMFLDAVYGKAGEHSPLDRLRLAEYQAENKHKPLTDAQKREIYQQAALDAQCPKLEHLSRPTMLALGHYYDKTSLFFQAVHLCFSEHYPLALSPEVLMYLVLHEVAVCVKQNPETYRHLFTTAAGKQTITVRHDGLRLGDPTSPWSEVLGMFRTGLANKVPAGIMEHALPDFSTHTVETQAASLVAFMDAASPYYSYRCMTMCGIPRIRLLGQPEDYRKLVTHCGALAEVFSAPEGHGGRFFQHQEGLGLYFQHLLPVLKKIADQADPATPVDNDFWSSIYKHLSASGTDAMSGWITAFLNYECHDGTFKAKDPEFYDWNAPRKGWPRGYERGSAPSHLSRVDFIWDYFGKELEMQFIGGILGLEGREGYVTPQLAWAVAHKG